MWRGFILTMAKVGGRRRPPQPPPRLSIPTPGLPPPQLELPTDLELLPGHIFQMEEALRRERENRCGAQRGGAAAAPP